MTAVWLVVFAVVVVAAVGLTYAEHRHDKRTFRPVRGKYRRRP